MKQLFIFINLIIFSTSSFAEVWATAISKKEDRAIIFRYIKEFDLIVDRNLLSDRVILVWKYKSKNGMPEKTERISMDLFEDLLSPVVEKNNFSTLALVSTGENIREWIYYTSSESEFLIKLNNPLKEQSHFPIEIHAAPDPDWTTYENFLKGGS